HGILAGPHLARLDVRCERIGRIRDPDGFHPVMTRGVRADPSRCSSEQPLGPMSVPPEQVHVASAQLGQALEELRVGRVARLLPRRLPRLMGGEESTGVEVLPTQTMVLFDRERVEVLELERVLRVPGLRATELVARPAGLVAGLGRPPGLAHSVFAHAPTVRPRGPTAAPAPQDAPPDPGAAGAPDPLLTDDQTRGAEEAVRPSADATRLPPWIPRLLLPVVITVFASYAAFSLIRRLSHLLLWLVAALFLSFALEPAVNWLVAH